MGFLDDNGLSHLWAKITAKFVPQVSGKGLSTNDYTTAEKNKLAGIAAGAQKNQNAFSNVKVGTSTVAADSETDTLTLVAGQNVSLVPDTIGDKVTIWATDTTYGVFGGATGTEPGTPGLVPEPPKGSEDALLYGDGRWRCIQLDGSAMTDRYSILMRFGPDAVDRTETATIRAVTSTTAGVMTPADKNKLDGFGDPSGYALKSDISGTYKYKGSVADATKLPTTGRTTGDVYNIEAASAYGAAGMNVAWNGTDWDPLGGILAVSAITNTEIDKICV